MSVAGSTLLNTWEAQGWRRFSNRRVEMIWSTYVLYNAVEALVFEASVESENLCFAPRHLSAVWSLILPAYSPNVCLRFPRSDTLSLATFGRYLSPQIADVHIPADKTLLTSKMTAGCHFLFPGTTSFV